jgi:hypothetical protein
MKSRVLNIVLVFASVGATIGGLELGVRILNNEFRLINFLGEERTLFKSAYPSTHDTELGWVPKEGISTQSNVWGKRVTIAANGVRSNGGGNRPGAASEAEPILAVGDSFTFGDQVADHETWPAVLETLLDRRVINGGVFGYGMDQSFLRALKLIPIYRPSILIFAFIPDDIRRCELDWRQGASKPYFEVAGERLVLKNVPVPPPAHLAHKGNMRQILGYSLLAHKLMMTCCQHYWLMGVTWRTFYSAHRIHQNGEAVACHLLKELEALKRRLGLADVFVLIQYTEQPDPSHIATVERLTAGCTGSGVVVVDLKKPLTTMREQDPHRYETLFDRHMTAAGNAFVAQELYRIMMQRR